MTITLELSNEQERDLKEVAARRDTEAVRAILIQALSPTINRLLTSTAPPEDAEYEALADRLADTFESTALQDQKPLPANAVSREGIYGDHL